MTLVSRLGSLTAHKYLDSLKEIRSCIAGANHLELHHQLRCDFAFVAHYNRPQEPGALMAEQKAYSDYLEQLRAR